MDELWTWMICDTIIIDACETLSKELLKSMKIAKKFKEEFKIV